LLRSWTQKGSGDAHGGARWDHASAHELVRWTSVSEAERYTKKADRARINLSSADKLISRTEIVKPETQFDKTPSKSLKTQEVKS